MRLWILSAVIIAIFFGNTDFAGSICPELWLDCGNGKCIGQIWVCDGEDDCGNFKDEENCGSIRHIPVIERTCLSTQFHCVEDGHCITDSWHCDGEQDCIDGSDEKNCDSSCSENNGGCSHLCLTTEKGHTCSCTIGMVLSKDGLTCTTVPSFCAKNQASCSNGKCIPMIWKCDGENDCPDGDDEKDCHATVCNEKTPFRCDSGQCLPKDWACDGTINCIDGTDERNCSFKQVVCDIEEFRCQDGTCIDKKLVCDQRSDCQDESDEKNCTYLQVHETLSTMATNGYHEISNSTHADNYYETSNSIDTNEYYDISNSTYADNYYETSNSTDTNEYYDISNSTTSTYELYDISNSTDEYREIPSTTDTQKYHETLTKDTNGYHETENTKNAELKPTSTPVARTTVKRIWGKHLLPVFILGNREDNI